VKPSSNFPPRDLAVAVGVELQNCSDNEEGDPSRSERCCHEFPSNARESSIEANEGNGREVVGSGSGDGL
jgi:hypothetical protein